MVQAFWIVNFLGLVLTLAHEFLQTFSLIELQFFGVTLTEKILLLRRICLNIEV